MPRAQGLALGRIQRRGSTSTDRDRDRHVRISVAAGAGLLAKLLVAGTLLIAVPLAADHLNPAELGVWTMLVSAVALVGWSDFGIGNGLLSVLADALGRDDDTLARRAVASAAVGLVAITVAMGLAAMLAVAVVPWEGLFGVGAGEVPSLRRTLAWFAAMVLVSVPAGIGQRIHLAYQQGWAASTTTAVGSVLSLLGVWLVARSDGSLPLFLVAMLGGTVLAYLGETAWVFARSHPDLRPRRADVDLATLRRLFRSGAAFFGLVLAGSIAYQTDALVIAHHLGAAAATTYVLTNRLFLLAPTVLSALLVPLWPAYGEAIARGDHAWVRRTVRRSHLGSAAVGGASAVVLLFVAQPLLRWWTPEATPERDLLLASAVWSVVSSVSLAVAAYLNGARLLRLQLGLAGAMAAANLALSLALVRSVGMAGPVWASVVTQTFIVLVPVAWMLVRRGVLDADDPAVAAPPSTTDPGAP